MCSWLFKGLFVCAFLFFGENTYAQYERKEICIEANPFGWAQCRLKPDGFDRWVYGSGYGVAPT